MPYDPFGVYLSGVAGATGVSSPYHGGRGPVQSFHRPIGIRDRIALQDAARRADLPWQNTRVDAYGNATTYVTGGMRIPGVQYHPHQEAFLKPEEPTYGPDYGPPMQALQDEGGRKLAGAEIKAPELSSEMPTMPAGASSQTLYLAAAVGLALLLIFKR